MSALLILFGNWNSRDALARRGGQLVVKVIDRDTKKPIACRMHLTRQKNKRKGAVRVPKVPSWNDHFVIDGEITLKLSVGNYTFVMERGPEYLVRSGHFRIETDANDEKVIDMKRFINMAERGWYAGDLHAFRPLKDIETLMRSEDLYVVPITSWHNKKNLWKKKPLPTELLTKFDEKRFYHANAGYDKRLGNMVQYFQLEKPLKLPPAKSQSPTAMSLITEAKKNRGAHVNVANPFSLDFPIWVAHGAVDSVSLANSHLQRTKVIAGEAGGLKRNQLLYPAPHGNGRWSQDIYYHLLKCGLRIAPAAGSGSGEVSNPIGYNRVYVYVDGEMTYEKWWAGLKAGRSVITNGPLMLPNANGKLPGHVFFKSDAEELEIKIALTLSTQNKITYLEVIQDGELAHEVRLMDWKKARGKLPPIRFTKSGWFLIRAVTQVSETYRFASSAPYYVSIHGKPRISKASAKFFLDWTKKRQKQLAESKIKQSEASKKQIAKALEYWQNMVDRATVE